MYGYIYMTTNLINNKKYIGRHKSKIFDKNYIGSGKYLLRAVRKYGKNNFSTCILEQCNSEDELNEKEKYWISYHNATESKDFYNIIPGGTGGDPMPYLDKSVVSMIRKNHSKYILERLNNDKEFHDKFAGAKKGHYVSDETKKKISNSSIGIKRSKSATLSESVSNRNKSRIWITNEKEDKFIESFNLDYYINNGYRLGRRFIKRNRKCATTIESIANEKYISE